MSIEEKLNEHLSSVSNQIAGTIGLSIVELESGLALATLSNKKDFNLEVAAAYNAEVVKQKLKAMTALNLKGESIIEMQVYLTTQTHTIRFINPKYILYFAVDGTTSNVAMIKMVLNSVVPEIAKEITGL